MMKIGFSVVAMADSEVRKLIDPKIIAKIKSIDPKPTVRVYGIGQEGYANPRIPEMGGINIDMVFSRKVIQQIADNLALDTPVYAGHYNTDPDEPNRIRVGTVVGRGTKEIDGKLNALAAIYIEPEHRDAKLDIASIEAFTEMVYDDKTNRAAVIAISDIRAVALGNSELDNPAFDTAKLKAEIAAFAAETTTKARNSMNLDDLTPGMVREFVRRNNWSLGELFTREEIRKDSAIAAIVEDMTAPMAKKIAELETEKAKVTEEFTAKVSKYGEELAKTKVTTKLPEIAKQRQLNDKQVAYIMAELTNAKLDVDRLDEQLPSFVDATVERFNALAKLIGSGTENNADANTNGTKPAIPPSDKSQTASGDLSAVPADLMAVIKP
jgi:hypothetical protein